MYKQEISKTNEKIRNIGVESNSMVPIRDWLIKNPDFNNHLSITVGKKHRREKDLDDDSSSQERSMETLGAGSSGDPSRKKKKGKGQTL